MSELDAKKVINQPFSGKRELLMEWINKLKQELIANIITLKSIKDFEKVIIYDNYGVLYIGKLVGIDPTNLNIFLTNAFNVRENYVVKKVLIRGDVVKRIEYITDNELSKIMSKIVKKEKKG